MIKSDIVDELIYERTGYSIESILGNYLFRLSLRQYKLEAAYKSRILSLNYMV